jgi:hypothetical protein
VVTLGTEHNAPGLTPVAPYCSDKPLTGFLRQVNYEGACVIAAHQSLKTQENYRIIEKNRNDMTQLGNAVIRKWGGL